MYCKDGKDVNLKEFGLGTSTTSIPGLPIELQNFQDAYFKVRLSVSIGLYIFQHFNLKESENLLKEMKEKREKINFVEAEENNDFFTPTPEKSPKLDKRNVHSENDTSTLPTYSVSTVFRRARKIRPKDNIGLDFFH